MTRFILGAVLAAFLAGSTPAFSEETDSGETVGSEGCMIAIAELDDYLLAIPNTCEADEECVGFYFRADTCAQAVMLPKKFETDMKVIMPLIQLQMATRAACTEEFKYRPVCKQPKPYKPACRENVCVNEWAK